MVENMTSKKSKVQIELARRAKKYAKDYNDPVAIAAAEYLAEFLSEWRTSSEVMAFVANDQHLRDWLTNQQLNSAICVSFDEKTGEAIMKDNDGESTEGCLACGGGH